MISEHVSDFRAFYDVFVFVIFKSLIRFQHALNHYHCIIFSADMIKNMFSHSLGPKSPNSVFGPHVPQISNFYNVFDFVIFKSLIRWGELCRAQEIHPVTPPINDVVEFLSLYSDGGRFGVIATARSALGNFLHVPGVPVLANHPLIQKVVKGAYNTRPPAPRYVVIWDTDVLLHYLDFLDNACLNFKLLSCKNAILLTILSGQRMSIIHAFRLCQLQLTTDMAIFNLGTTLLKHSRPGRSTPPIVFHRYPHGRWLCPLQTIRDYVTQSTLLAPQIDTFFYHSPQALSSGFQGYAPFQWNRYLALCCP